MISPRFLERYFHKQEWRYKYLLADGSEVQASEIPKVSDPSGPIKEFGAFLSNPAIRERGWGFGPISHNFWQSLQGIEKQRAFLVRYRYDLAHHFGPRTEEIDWEPYCNRPMIEILRERQKPLVLKANHFMFDDEWELHQKQYEAQFANNHKIKQTYFGVLVGVAGDKAFQDFSRYLQKLHFKFTEDEERSNAYRPMHDYRFYLPSRLDLVSFQKLVQDRWGWSIKETAFPLPMIKDPTPEYYPHYTVIDTVPGDQIQKQPEPLKKKVL